jgi:hypothetical protein
MPMPRCADCGFLAVVHRTSRQLMETEPQLRSDWTMPVIGSYSAYESAPVCASQAMPLGEVENLKRNSGKEAVLTTIRMDRQCNKFTPWRPGLPIEEYHRMLLEQQMLKAQEESRERDRKWQDEQRQGRQQFEASQREKDQARQDMQRADDLERERIRRKSDRIWTAIFILVAAMVGLLFEPVKAWLNGTRSAAQSGVMQQKPTDSVRGR